jgi:nucleoside-diphosphate-sugar epimerase
MTHRLLSFGHGYSARALARRLGAEGWTVAGTSRGAAGAEALAAEGIEGHVFARGRPLAPEVLAGVTHVLVSIPPDDAGDPVLDAHGADLAALPGLRWVGYLSTTGVYGDHDGGWVDETTPLAPVNERGRRRAAAEAGWLSLGRTRGLPVHVFRLAGIYGPGRSQIESVRDGTAKRTYKPGQVFSRIHVDDIAAVLAASIARPRPGAVYNVCDDEAAPPWEVVEYACNLLGAPVPPLVPIEEANLSEMGRSFYAENKRVSNRLIHEELGVVLKYPTYREGLAALAKD